MGTQSNRQGESQLLAEWMTRNCPTRGTKTHVRVGDQALVFQGVPPNPGRFRAFELWSDWCDARISWGHEVWLVEAKLVGVAAAYGQIMDYAQQYPASADYAEFSGQPIIPVVLCAYEKPLTARYFANYGIRTIIFTPSWAARSLTQKIFGSTVDL